MSDPPSSPAPSRLSAVGTGLLFAATAVGVSHLVQSTRAGAKAGLGFAGLILLGHLLKYPAFRFGPHYAAARGASLLQGYRRQGRWALGLYLLVTLGTMFTVQAAVTLLTTGLLLAVLDVRMNPVGVSAVLLAVGALVLAVGKYRWLDRITRGFVLVLTLSTLLAAGLTLPRVDWSTLGWGFGAFVDPAQVAFAVALVGWMPSALDVSVWQSLWVRAQGAERGRAPGVDEATFDFHLGYAGTFVLALAFLVLGAGLIHGRGVELPASAPGFARGLIDLYADTLGAWTRPLIGASALAAMASTTLAVLDGFPRALAGLALRWSSDENELEETTGSSTRAYWLALGLLSVGSLLVMAALLTSLRQLIDLATTLSFLTAPALAGLNHRAVFSGELPKALEPKAWLRWMSLGCIVAHLALAGWYLASR